MTEPFANTSRARWPALLPALLALLFALGLWAALDPVRVRTMVAEGGAIELATAWLYFALAALMWLARRPGDDAREWAALSLLLLAFGARELDLHRAWTHDSVLKLSFYLRDVAALHQKLVAGAAVLLLAATIVFLVRRFARRVWRSFRRGAPVATTVAIFVGVMFVAKVFDRSINILAVDFGIVTPLAEKALVSAVEEILELSLPFIAAVGFVQHRCGPRP